MALVRISKALIHDVENGIKSFASKVYDDTIATICPTAATNRSSDPAVIEFCERKLFGDDYHLKALVPGKWLKHPTRFDLHVRDVNNGNSLTYYVEAAPGAVLNAPPTVSDYAPDIVVTLEEFSLIDGIQEFFAQKALFTEARKVHVEKFNTILTQVLTFLNGSKSLNDAVKKYPDIKLWIPQSYLTELDRVVERTSRAAKEKADQESAVSELDLSLLASMGVMKTIQASS
jgi:hypothetical protein